MAKLKLESAPFRNWVSFALINFCILASIGVLLRSKILFAMPFFDYNRLLDAHFHFAFSGWVTLSLFAIMVYELLPEAVNRKPIYTLLLYSILITSWLLLISSPLPANSIYSSLFSLTFILVTYAFCFTLIKDLLHSSLSQSVLILSVSSLICLALSSLGLLSLAYLFASKSLNMFAYRDSLYTYLHLMYNGFFSLSVFSIILHKLEKRAAALYSKQIRQFALMLSISIFPSLFLTYLWRDPNDIYRILAILGSFTLFATAALLINAALAVRKSITDLPLIIKLMGTLALLSFLLKTVLQCFTIFPEVGNAVFGDRPVIIGFLHLVFLGFVSMFLIAFLIQSQMLSFHLLITRIAVSLFITAVIFNEIILMTQGLFGMFIQSSQLFPWFLWGLSILLLISAILTTIAHFITVNNRLKNGTNH